MLMFRESNPARALHCEVAHPQMQCLLRRGVWGRACDFPPNYTTPNCPLHEEIIISGSQYTQLLAMSFAITGKLGYHELLSLFLSISLCLLSPNMSA